jgi:hypothetical protein
MLNLGIGNSIKVLKNTSIKNIHPLIIMYYFTKKIIIKHYKFISSNYNYN